MADELARPPVRRRNPDERVRLGAHVVRRVGFGAMQLPGKGVFGPPRDRDEALSVLRRVRDAGVDHIDTAQFYGPNVANELICEALYPYDQELVIVSKVGAARGEDGSWGPAQRPEQLRAGVEANLSTLRLEQVHVMNLRRHPDSEVPFSEQVDAMIELRDEGLIGAIGLSNVDLEHYERARARTEIVCVQNLYNLADRSGKEVLDACVRDEVAFVPFFPLGSAFDPEKAVLSAPPVQSVAGRLGITPAQVALSWLLYQSPLVALIPGTSSLSHLEENLAVSSIELDEPALEELDGYRKGA